MGLSSGWTLFFQQESAKQRPPIISLVRRWCAASAAQDARWLQARNVLVLKGAPSANFPEDQSAAGGFRFDAQLSYLPEKSLRH